MPRTAIKKNETREEQQLRELRAIGAIAYESILEMVGKLDATDEDGNDDDQAREEACTAILEDALSCEVRSGWCAPDDAREGAQAPVEFRLLLGTGGPAVRIIGDLDEHGQPTRARLQVQYWGTPWTDYEFHNGAPIGAALLAYASCFYFGEG